MSNVVNPNMDAAIAALGSSAPAPTPTPEAPDGKAPAAETKPEEKTAPAPAPEAKVEEKPTPTPAPESKPEEATTEKFLALQKRDRQLLEKERKLKEEIEAERVKLKNEIAAKEAEVKARADKIARFESLMEAARTKQDFDTLFSELGVTYDDLAHWKIKGTLPEAKRTQEALKPLQDEIAALKKAQDDFKAEQAKAAEEAKKSQAQAAYNQFLAGVESTLKAEADKYELLAKSEDPTIAQRVYQTVAEVYERSGGKKLLKVADVLAKMEELEVARVEKLLASNKLKTKYQPAAKDAPKDAPKPAPAADNKAEATLDRMEQALAALKKVQAEISKPTPSLSTTTTSGAPPTPVTDLSTPEGRFQAALAALESRAA
jgi:hypothetical protein